MNIRKKIRKIILEELSSKYGATGFEKANKKNLFLDRPTSHGGWPEGEYDPPIRDVIYNYLKSLGLSD